MLMHRPQTPQPGFGSVTLKKFTPHFKILDPRLLPLARLVAKRTKTKLRFSLIYKLQTKTRVLRTKDIRYRKL